jgi:serine/threonine-protein kinase
MSQAADVFISYKAEDRPRIQPLIEALQAEGYSVWWDQHIGTGDDWRNAIEQQLEAAKCVVVAWSRNSVGPAGRFVRDEATRAQRRHVYAPVLIDAVEPPLGFGEQQATSLVGWRGDRADPRYQAVLAAVQRIAGGASAPAAAVAKKQGIDRRVFLAGGAAVALTAAGIGVWALSKRKVASASDSIAVLPFENLSGDAAQSYFADGIAGEIRNTLMRVGGLKVAGSTSSAAVRAEDARSAAKKLGVGNILTGSFRQTQSTIRVTAELIDGETGLAKWSQNYDRAPGDVIKIQSEIAESVARALAVALGASAREALAVGETSNVAAQRLVFQARDLSYQYTKETFERCVVLLDQAIGLDPNYARAYAIKSFVISNLASYERTPASRARGREEALQLARTALSIAPNLPIARSALAYALALTLQLKECLKENQAALALAGSDPDVLRNYGWTLSGLFGNAEGLQQVDEALALDPLNPASYLAHVDVLYRARRYADAVSYSTKLRRESPELFTFPGLLGHCLLFLGRTAEAAAAFAQDGYEDARTLNEALLSARTGRRDIAASKLATLRQRGDEMASFEYAKVYAQIGDKDGAFAALNHAWEIRDPSVGFLRVDPYLDPLRQDPRYAALVREIGFPERI